MDGRRGLRGYEWQRSYRGDLSEWMDKQGNEANERRRSYREELIEWMDEHD